MSNLRLASLYQLPTIRQLAQIRPKGPCALGPYGARSRHTATQVKDVAETIESHLKV